MDAHLFRIFCNAAEPLLLNARLDKIQEPAPGHLRIGFYGGGTRSALYCRFGRKDPFCFVSNERMDAPPQPSAPVMRIRKYCAGKRVAAVVPQFLSRKLWLMTGAENGKTIWLCLDLASGAALRFLTDMELPEPEKAAWPSPASLPQALGDWRSWPALTPLLRKSMQYMEEREQWALMADLADGGGDVFLYAGADGTVRKAAAWPLPPALAGGLAESACEDHLASFAKAGQDMVLAQICSARDKNLAAAANRRDRHIRKLLDKLDMDEKRLNAMTAREKEARILAANLWRWNARERAAKVEVPAEAGQEAQTILLPRPRLTISENMEKMFHDARRGKRGLAMQAERRAALKAELAGLRKETGPQTYRDETGETAPPPRKPVFNAPKRIQPFWSSDGLVMLRGRDASGNLAALRSAAGHDIWVHVEKGAGAHVIIRRPHPGFAVPERTLQEAGSLAANKSWLAGAASASVMYAEARHVKPCRGGPAGKVTIDRIMQTRIVPLDAELEMKLA